MDKTPKILGTGQIWDVKGILDSAKEKTFEDIFSGRALGEMARETLRNPSNKKIFSKFKDKGKITGVSVTKALLSKNKRARGRALLLLSQLARNGTKGIEILTKGIGEKPGWPEEERNFWKDLDVIIIGGGVSENTTGDILVLLLKRYLSERGLGALKVYQARFPGKEAGFLGAVANICEPICKEAKKKKLKKVAAIGIDLGRDDIGVGLLKINSKKEDIVLNKREYCGVFHHSIKTPYSIQRKAFLDSRESYTKKDQKLGIRIRETILEKIANLVMLAKKKADDLGLETSRHIAVSIPGCTLGKYIINSTDYLPFFRKKDGFNLAGSLEELLVGEDLKSYHVHIINDGIAAGIANVYFSSFKKAKGKKFAFFGVGSGLAGCVGII